MKNVIKGRVNSPKLYLKIKGVVKQLETKSVCDCDCDCFTLLTLFPCGFYCSLMFTLSFNLFGIEFVTNRALWVALNLSRITHFSCKFLGSKKSACVKVLTYSTSGLRHAHCSIL